MKKHISKIIISILILVISIFWFTYLRPSLKIATGYTAKYVCSSTFLSNISNKKTESALNLFLIRSVKYSVDSTKMQVKASFLGLVKQTASYYKNGNSCGCIIGEPDFSNQEMKDSYLSQVKKDASEVLWPQGNELNYVIPQNIDSLKIKNILKNTLKANSEILAITVAYKNFLLGEEYSEGVDKNTRLLGWSMTKTIGNSLFGILEKNNIINVNDAAGIESWKNDERKNITINNLLQMSSGLNWIENYSKLSNVTTMLYLKENFPAYAIESKANEEPNQKWLYSSGTTNILSKIMRSKFDSYDEYLSFPYDSLFHQINMKSAIIELDNNGNHLLSSYGWANARDWTRFGLLYLNNGNWFGKQIFSEKWVEYSTTPALKSNGKYGAQIWLNTFGEKLPSVPHDAYYENGFGGQRILIIPSKNIVITILSGNQNDFDFDLFYKNVLSCF